MLWSWSLLYCASSFCFSFRLLQFNCVFRSWYLWLRQTFLSETFLLSCQTDASTVLKKNYALFKEQHLMTLGCLTRECQTSYHNTCMTLYDVVPVTKAFWHFLKESCSVTLSFLCSKLTNPGFSNLGSEIICSENLSYINKEKGTLLGNEDRVKCRWHCYL